MTCIVGLVREGRVWMGADSAAASGWTVRAGGIEKLFRRGPFGIGFTSSFRMGQILHYEVEFPQAEQYDEAYMVTQFVPAVREKFKALGFARIESNEEKGGIFLVGVKGRLFEVQDDFQVSYYPDGLGAVGCGGEYALGALRAAEITRVVSESGMVRLALETAAYFSGGVKPPFTIWEV